MGTPVGFSKLGATSVTVSWGAASDATSSSGAELLYKVVRASDPTQIDTLEEVAAITAAPALVQDFTRGLTSTDVANLTPATAYAFAVVVRDDAGNAALYAPATITTLDASAPTPGAAISFSELTAESVRLDWGAASDDVTPAAQLRYKVVGAFSASEIDSLEEVAAITTFPQLIADDAPDLTTVSVVGLSSSRTYAFAVMVRDAQGNRALYAPATISTVDVTPPSVGAITFRDIAANTLTVQWEPAADDVTPASALQYKVVRASEASAIDTLDEADVIVSGDGLVADYAAGTSSAALTGLESSTAYAFAVVARDAAGNRALYTPAVATTLDVTAPVIGGAIAVSNVSANGLDLAWPRATDDLTAQEQLAYKVVKALTSAELDTVEEVAAIVSGTGLVQDFTPDLQARSVTGLFSSITYAFAVLVRDQQGNQALYSPVTRQTLDDTTPIAGAALSFGDITSSSLTVSWGRATDNVSPQSALRYKLVMADTLAAIDTLAEADAITAGPGLVLDWAVDLTSRAVTGLASSRTYAFALIVRDAAGNKTLYAPATVSTLDVSAPTVGTAITFQDVTVSQIGLQWGAATDDITAATALTYKVVRGVNASAVDTLEEVDAITSGPNLLADYTANLTSATATGLSGSTAYAFAVVVRDAAGNRALYTPATRFTLDATPPVAGASIHFSGVLATEVTVEWGAGTDDLTTPANLQYQLVRAASASDLGTLEQAAAATVVQPFTAELSSVRVPGLTSSTRYAFAVIVRDEAGNQTLYAPAEIATLDVSAPTPGLALAFSAVSATGMTVSWGAASDDVSAASVLQYKVVSAASTAAIDTLPEVAAITSGPSLVADYTANLTSTAVTGLGSSRVYAFAVVVRDEAGNEALYAPASQATLDVTAPSVGTAITFSGQSATGVTVQWGAASDDVSATANLQYKVVKATTTAAIDTVSEAAAISGADLVQNYTANITSLPVSGLSSSSTYAFAVLVRDQAGNESLYAPALTSTLDVTAPTAGTAISFSNLTASSFTIDWGAATDDITSASSLQYRVVTAAAVASIDSISEVDAITGTGLIQDYTANITSANVTGLSPTTSYAAAVVVRDAAGNKTLYTPATVTTASNPPTFTTQLTFSSVNSTGFTASWAATDDVTPRANLEYRLVRATTAAAIDTVAEAVAISGGDLLMNWTANTTSFAVTGLTAGDTRFYAVVARDADGVASISGPSVRVVGRLVYAATAAHNGNFGGVAGADAWCASNRHPAATQNGTVKAMVVHGTTRRACSSATCTTTAGQNIDWVFAPNTPYYNVAGQIVGTTNGGGIFPFMFTSPYTGLTNPFIPGTTGGIYTGLTSTWTNNATNCDGWTNASAGTTSGYPGQIIWSAIYGLSGGCNYPEYTVLCVEQ